MGRGAFLQSALGFAAGVAAIGMMAKAAEAMTLAAPSSAFPLPLGEWIEQAQHWGDDEDWRHRYRWHGNEDNDDDDDDDDN